MSVEVVEYQMKQDAEFKKCKEQIIDLTFQLNSLKVHLEKLKVENIELVKKDNKNLQNISNLEECTEKLEIVNSILKYELEIQNRKYEESLSQIKSLNQTYLKTLSQFEDYKKAQKEVDNTIKSYNFDASFDLFASNLEKKLSIPKCEICNTASAYICTLHNPYASLCNIHLRRHIGGNHKLLRLFDTNAEIPDLDALIKLQAKKVLENKQKIMTFISNTMIDIERLTETLIGKFDEIFNKVVIMKTVGKPIDFDFMEISQFDKMAEDNFLMEWLTEKLRKNHSNPTN
ncbi:hypothetical protein SteCoe_17720 [Stentor coeruleus]|uniref:Uncharacterized protein n=1 Tax=Stentor coeruleus TaxID=5963 RepID=A0A1R2BY45_9CILI|nr:hypothetical protein SteCoe_17720 [Stentor coeruleus]